MDAKTKTSPRILFDHSQQTGVLSRETRKALQKLMSELHTDRMAGFGFSNFNRVLGRIIVTLAGQSAQICFFETQVEALAWLSEEPQDEA